MLSCSVLPGMQIISLSSVFMLYILPTCQSLSGCLGFQTDCLGSSVLVLSNYIYSVMAPKCKNSDTGNSVMPKKKKQYICRKNQYTWGSVLSVASGLYQAVLEHISTGKCNVCKKKIPRYFNAHETCKDNCLYTLLNVL